MEKKLVSVCINVYNAEKFILKTVNSVINQSYKNLQIIIVDDCSTDSTYDIIKSINDDRIEIYKTSFNGHMSFACNEALKHANGDYIAHLDADDLWLPEKIEKQVDFLEENLEYGACFTHAEIIDDDDNIADESQNFLREIFALKNHTHAELYRFFYDNSNKLCHSSVLFRKEIAQKVGMYDTTILYLQDFDYWMRLLTGAHLYIYPERLSLVRRHADNNSDMNEEKWNAHNTEFARLIYNSINICPDSLFLEAFKDKLKFQGEHTHEETELEKAFLLLDGPLVYKGNPVLGLYKFSKLFEDEKYIKLAREKFNFTTRDLYNAQSAPSYFDPAKNAELMASLSNITDEKEYLSSVNKIQEEKISDLTQEVENLNATVSQQSTSIQELNALYKSYKASLLEAENNFLQIQNSFLEIQNSFFWRLTKPMRILSQKLKDIIAHNNKLLILAIYAKGFLRGGHKRGKLQVDNYKREMGILITKKDSGFNISKKTRAKQEATVFEKKIKFSILVPLYNTPMDFLEQMIESVRKQTYSKWELCLVDGSDDEHSYVKEYCLGISKKDARIKYSQLAENRGISENTNECLKMATGNYIALFDHDDVLDPTVLFEYMKVICEQNADFIYCDEDKFNEFGGELYDANYKPDFAADNLRANNYICHFTVFDKSLIEKSGAFRKEFDGSQDHDLILRLTEQAKNIVHIPKVLYHWRVSAASVASDPYAKPYTIEAGKKAVAEHLERVGLKGSVESTKIHPNIYRIKYDIIGNPLVSIIIPNYNHVEELSRCIDSIINKSTYKNYEIIIVENNSNEETFAYYDTLKKHKNIKVVVYKTTEGFNYSAINNYGVKFASGEHYILVNNDVEIITPEWIEEMLMYSQRDDVGAVGAMLYYPNDTIQHAGVTIGVLTLAGHNFKHLSRGNPGYFGRAGYQQNVSAVTAACLMLPAKVYEQVNGLDESFAVAFNDIDFCMRIRQAGYHIIFTPFAELYHYESISRGSDETPEKRVRFVSEVERFQTRWKKELAAGDPYYNPNLTLDREDFSPKQ